MRIIFLKTQEDKQIRFDRVNSIQSHGNGDITFTVTSLLLPDEILVYRKNKFDTFRVEIEAPE